MAWRRQDALRPCDVLVFQPDQTLGSRETGGRLDVLVVGAGVSGLTTAVCLAEAGFRVQMWSAESRRQTTSFAAGAMWGPYLETGAEYASSAVSKPPERRQRRRSGAVSSISSTYVMPASCRLVSARDGGTRRRSWTCRSTSATYNSVC
ncbi:FAD-dependent oxidoreductase [Micromonospora sp. NPDC050417]|uniref:FAD-dependent oxidoreductase n=1 Tax=Micromonospora sp. NPDC050417 TaxID=3364280 RepID=UPI00378A8023